MGSPEAQSAAITAAGPGTGTTRTPAGAILYQGEDLLHANAATMRKIRGGEIAMIFQDPMTSLTPVHTVGDQIAEQIRAHRAVGRRAAADRAVELLNMVLAEIGRSGLIHEIHGGVHLVGGGALLPHLPILAQNILGRPRVVLGRVIGVLRKY